MIPPPPPPPAATYKSNRCQGHGCGAWIPQKQRLELLARLPKATHRLIIGDQIWSGSWYQKWSKGMQLYKASEPQHYSFWLCWNIFLDGCLEGTDRWEVERLGSEYLLLPSYNGWKWWSWQSDNPYHAQPGFFCCVFRDLGCKEIQSPLSRLWFQIFFMFTHVHPYLGKWSHLTNILETGWNQLVVQSLLMHQRSSRQSSASCGFLSRDICSPFIDHYPRSLSLNQTAYFKGFLRTRTFYA